MHGTYQPTHLAQHIWHNTFGVAYARFIEFEQMLLPMCLLSVIGGSMRFGSKQRELFLKHYMPWAARAGMRCRDENSNSGLSTKAFASMSKLRLLIIHYAHLEGGLEHLPKDLRWFSWNGCPLEYLPTTFHLQQLVFLDLENSKITQLRNCLHQEGKLHLGKLKVLDLTGCTSLIRTSALSGLLCLESLILKDCERLVEVDESIGHLQRFVFLDLERCHQLMELPSSMCELKYLEILNLLLLQ